MNAARRPGGLRLGLAASATLHVALAAWLAGRAVTAAVPARAPVRSVAVRVVAAPPGPAPAEVPAPPLEAPPLPPAPPRVTRTEPAPRPQPASAPAEPHEPVPAESPAPAAAMTPLETAAPESEAPVVAALPLPSIDAAPDRSDELARYEALLRQRIASHKRYPSMARRRGVEGTVRLVLSIDARGRLTALSSPGHAPLVLAKAAREAAEQAAPFSPPPDGSFRVELSLRFDLDD